MNSIRSTVAASLAILVMIASIGVTVNMHLCGGHVQSMAFFVKAAPCKGMKTPCRGTEHHAKKSGCCEEKSLVLKGKETNAEPQMVSVSVPSFSLIAVIPVVLYTIPSPDPFLASTRYTLYKPPLPQQDITVLVRSLLI